MKGGYGMSRDIDDSRLAHEAITSSLEAESHSQGAPHPTTNFYLSVSSNYDTETNEYWSCGDLQSQMRRLRVGLTKVEEIPS
jgi:hypothetical protein